ncbi:hypothetical protein CEE45_16745 [Candidatus Heimdallarchaeota archaeon B3_Heim]|nr:MAG: hypothetical protein CEE45_16745 [Candidatus Heimdallarchaeota archaeon B3_Heim]
MQIPLGVLIWMMSGFFFLLSSSYYILEMIPSFLRHRKDYLNPNIPSNQEILSLLSQTDQPFPKIKFQITTRGNEIDVVKRGIASIYTVSSGNQLFESNFELLVVTDNPEETKIFTDFFKELHDLFPSEAIVVPPEYRTPNSTLYKARSLQYSVEYRKSKKSSSMKGRPRSFIFYFDAESTIKGEDFRRIIHSVISFPDKKVFEGPIVYPHKYFKANVFSRQMEASRPFNCHHCAHVMKNPPPTHLHGSNLLVDEEIVNEIGWDFGRVDNRPLLAEDLIFGLNVYVKYGGSPFGWHGGRLSEQPPFSIRSSFNARTRWVTGAWQALKLLKKSPEFKKLSWQQQMSIKLRIRLRIMTHSLSFFATSFVILSLAIFLFPSFFLSFQINSELLSPSFRTAQFLLTRFIFLPGTLLWFFGIYIGSLKNLELIEEISQKDKIIEIIKLLIITPLAGPIESFSALYASIRWLIGKPYNSWAVTSK